MEKILPISIPPAETYQQTAFLMGIIQNNENVQALIYNSYINVSITKDEFWEWRFEFTNVACEDFRKRGVGEMDLFYLNNISKDKCVDFLKERIDQNNFLLMFKIDEYEISYSEHYHNKHFEHDTYIFGYNDKIFYVMAYTDGHLRLMGVKQEEIIESLYNHQHYFGNTHFCSFRIHHCAREVIQLDEILSEINEYLKGYVEGNEKFFGVKTYNVIQEILSYTKESNGGIELSTKVFRSLWEHKKVMNIRNHYLGLKIEGLKQINSEIDTVVKTGHMIFMLTIKYNVKRDIFILDKISKYLQEMKEAEKRYLLQFQRIVEVFLEDERESYRVEEKR